MNIKCIVHKNNKDFIQTIKTGNRKSTISSLSSDNLLCQLNPHMYSMHKMSKNSKKIKLPENEMRNGY